jgi:hypothetical protein
MAWIVISATGLLVARAPLSNISARQLITWIVINATGLLAAKAPSRSISSHRLTALLSVAALLGARDNRR